VKDELQLLAALIAFLVGSSTKMYTGTYVDWNYLV
jgi:hypothetical protein